MDNQTGRQPSAQQTERPQTTATIQKKNQWTLLLAGLTVASFIVAVLLIGQLHLTWPALTAFSVTETATDSSERVQGWGYLPPSSSKNETVAEGLMVLFADIASPRTSDRIMVAAMADMGYGTVIIQIGRAHV